MGMLDKLFSVFGGKDKEAPPAPQAKEDVPQTTLAAETVSALPEKEAPIPTLTVPVEEKKPEPAPVEKKKPATKKKPAGNKPKATKK